MLVGKRLLINLPSGVNKNDNSYTVLEWSNANRIRFFKNFPQKIGGWVQIIPNPSNIPDVRGSIRSLFSWRAPNGIEILMIGSSYGLYAYISGQLTNITPLQTSSVTLSGETSTAYYGQVTATEAFSTVKNSFTITMSIAPFSSNQFQVGDIVTISGASSIAGTNILSSMLNGAQYLSAVTNTTISFNIGTMANATVASGGGQPTIALQVITLTYPGNTLQNGDRIAIAGMAAFNNFTTGNLNGQFIVRNVQSGSFDYINFGNQIANNTTLTATQNVTVNLQIPPGNATLQNASGYGGGYYGGVGNPIDYTAYSTDVPFTGGYQPPQIWSFDIFGQGIVMTPGNQGAIYTWDGNIAESPVALIANPNIVINLGTNPITTTNSSNLVNINVGAGNIQDFLIGQNIVISGVTGTIGGIAAATFNSTFQVIGISGNNIIIALGSNATSTQTGGGSSVIITIPSNAVVPTTANYVFTSHGQVVAFGAAIPDLIPQGQAYAPNQISTSNTADAGNWQPGPNTTAFTANISGATILIGRGFVRDQEVLFTQNAVYTFNYVGLPDVWVTQKICESDGLIGPRAVTSINDLVFWMGNNDFYMYNGAVYTIIPNNTLKNWVFQNINWSTAYLSFIRSCLEFNEIWFFFPYGNSPEPNAYAIFNFEEGIWTNGFLTRTASEEPSNEARPQYMAASTVALPLIGNPISTTAGSNLATINVNNFYFDNNSDIPNPNVPFFDANMYITIAGVSGTIGGVAASVFNNTFIIDELSMNNPQIVIKLPENATTSQTGGGTSCTITIVPNIFQHEIGYGCGNQNTPFFASLETNYALIDQGDFAQQISRVVPSTDVDYYDTIQDVNEAPLYQVTVTTKMYDGDTVEITNGPYNISLNTTKIDLRALGRQRKYTFSSNTYYPFRLQRWYEEVRQSTPR